MKANEKMSADQFVNVNGIKICYDDFGSSETPIIFIHGFPFNKSTWDTQIQFLKSKHRVIAYDIRGFGKSDPGIENYSIDLFAEDLIAFMDSLGIKKAVVCGFSMGGYILLNAIGRYPDRFRAIILSDTQCIADTEEGRQKRMKSISEIEAGGLENFATGFIKAVFSEESILNRKEVVEKIKNTILSTKPSSITKTLLALAQRKETCSSLTHIKVPTLILCGEKDIVTVPAQSETLSKNIENSEFHLIPAAGHMSNLEQAEIFNQHFQDFIEKLQ